MSTTIQHKVTPNVCRGVPTIIRRKGPTTVRRKRPTSFWNVLKNSSVNPRRSKTIIVLTKQEFSLILCKLCGQCSADFVIDFDYVNCRQIILRSQRTSPSVHETILVKYWAFNTSFFHRLIHNWSTDKLIDHQWFTFPWPMAQGQERGPDPGSGAATCPPRAGPPATSLEPWAMNHYPLIID